MLNNSVTQLRQISLVNVSLPRSARRRELLTSSATSSPSRAEGTKDSSEGDEHHSRPAVLRRRSTRGNPVSEPPVSRLQRLDVAIGNHCVESFFALYDVQEAIYISEILPGISPTFLPFALDCRSRSVDIVIYTRQTERRWRRLLTQRIDLGKVVLIGTYPSTNTKNLILMQLTDDVWYTSTPLSPREESHYITPRGDSYSLGQVLRLQSSTECINDSLHSITSLKSDLNALLEEAEDRTACVRQMRIAKARLIDIHREIKQIKKGNSLRQARNPRLRDAISLRRSLISSARQQISSTRGHLMAEREKQFVPVDALQLLSSEINRLQRQLTTSLTEIYPIQNTAGVNKIRGVRTAKDSDYWMHNPEESAALGYVAHFVFLLSYYLSIPLRYPIRPLSSHSYVIDPVSILPSTSDQHGGPPYSLKRDCTYPLFLEKGGSQRLQWAVFLLNKDIEQLLQGRGLVCGDIRHSLPNLEGLIVWLVSVNEDENRALSAPAIVVNGRPQDGLASPERDAVTHNGSEESLRAPEITDHDDLLAAQLRSVMRQGKSDFVTHMGIT